MDKRRSKRDVTDEPSIPFSDQNSDSQDDSNRYKSTPVSSNQGPCDSATINGCTNFLSGIGASGAQL
jgi:hypothetical protein